METKPGQLTKEQVDRFFSDGFVLVPQFFAKEELAPAIKGVEECVDILADRLYDAGLIENKATHAGFYQRLIQIEEQFAGAAVLLHKLGYLPKAFRDLWSNNRLLNAVEQFIGPDIAGHPVWNLRTKTPVNEETTVPWHQDNAYLDTTCLSTLQPTAWIPLLDTNKENGCMQVVRGGHRRGVTATHTCCAGNTWYVDLPPKEIEETLGVSMTHDVVTCEVPMGGVLFLNNAIPHRSLENFSDKIRWSFDFRWQRPDLPNGFHGLKESIPMRKKDDPNYKIDWSGDSFLEPSEIVFDFEPIIVGPWMKRWEITHHNKHTRALQDGGTLSWHGQNLKA